MSQCKALMVNRGYQMPVGIVWHDSYGNPIWRTLMCCQPAPFQSGTTSSNGGSTNWSTSIGVKAGVFNTDPSVVLYALGSKSR